MVAEPAGSAALRRDAGATLRINLNSQAPAGVVLNDEGTYGRTPGYRRTRETDRLDG